MIPIQEAQTLTVSESRNEPRANRRGSACLLLAALVVAWGGNAILAQAPDSIRAADAIRSGAFDPTSGRAPRRRPVVSSASGLCTDPLPGVAAPHAPHGIFVLEFPGASLKPVYDYILKQPEVCGGNVFVVWSAVDKGPDASGNERYDWSSVDNDIAPWTAAGKQVNLIVWAVGDTLPNTATPAYVLQAPGYQSVSCAYSGTTISSFPVYYLDPYKSYLKTFHKAVLERYGANPNIGYIRLGISKGGEETPTCATQLGALSGSSTWAQFDALWESFVTEMTEFQKTVQAGGSSSSGRQVQLMTALDGQFGTPPQHSVADFEAKNAASLGFGFGDQAFNQDDIAAYQSGEPCNSDWCAMFKMYAGQVPLELQLAESGSDPTNAPGGVGSMTVLVPFALSLRTQVFELTINDLQVAYDPTSPNYVQYGQAYRQVYQQAAETVGYGSPP
jgi:hypothetical protein